MLAAVHFHDEPGRNADEIRDVRADRNLAAKLGAAEAAIAEVVPEAIFGLGEACTKTPGKGG